MSEQTTQPIGHETRDVSVHGVIGFALGLVLACAAIFLLTIGLYRLFVHQHPSPEAASRLALDPHMIAPPPQLQISPGADYEQFRASEEAKLNSYGWVDKEAGIIRIPIERAMDLIARRGLPT